MSDANPTIDPIGYRCDGCGRLCRDPLADISSIRAAGGLACCPERKMVGLSDHIKELEAELHLIKTAGIIEVSVRNASVMEYMTHWEGRTEAAEAKLSVAVEAK